MVKCNSHLCIISRNIPKYHNITVNSFIKCFGEPRKIHTVIEEANDIRYDIFKTNKIVVGGSINKSSLLNNLFVKMLNEDYKKIIYLWEGEICVGENVYPKWSNNSSAFLKLGSIDNEYWELREFFLPLNWIFKDTNAKFPTINSTKKHDPIIKIGGSYVINDLIIKDNACISSLNMPYFHYTNACKLLLTGDLPKSEYYFTLRCLNKKYDEHRSRAYLGLAICKKLQNKSKGKIFKLLEKSIDCSINGQLESLYFLFKWSLELNNVSDAIKLFDSKYENIINLYQEFPPINGILPYDKDIYKYGILWYYLNCLLEVNMYDRILPICYELIYRGDIPTLMKTNTMKLIDYIKMKNVEFVKYGDCISDTNDLKKAINMSISKKYKIGIYQNHNNLLVNIADNTIFKDSKLNYEIVTDIHEYVIHIVYACNHCTEFSVWNTNDVMSECLFPLTKIPNIGYHNEKVVSSITNKSNIYKLGIIGCLGEKFKNVFKDKIKVNYECLDKVDKNISSYHTIFYYTISEDIEYQLYNVLLCLSYGCKVIFYGNPDVYKLLNKLFSTYLIGVCGWEWNDIYNIINNSIQVINSRLLLNIVSNFTFSNCIYNYIFKNDNKPLAIITTNDEYISPYVKNNFCKIYSTPDKLFYNDIQKQYTQFYDIIQEKNLTNDKIILINRKFSYYNYKISTLLMSNNVNHEIVEIVDSVGIMPLYSLYDFGNFSFESVSKVNYDSILVINNVNTLITLIGCIKKNLDPVKYIDIKQIKLNY